MGKLLRPVRLKLPTCPFRACGMWLVTHPLFSFVQNFRMQALHTLNQRTPAKDLHRFWA